MIENEREYQITRSQAENFERALAEMQARPAATPEIDPLVQQAITRGMQSQLEELRAEIVAYEALRSDRQALAEPIELDDLPLTPPEEVAAPTVGE